MTATVLERPEQTALDFDALMKQHQAMVFSVAYHYLHNRDVAQEVAQDVFFSLHRNLSLIQSSAHAAFWLRKVAVQRSIDEGRRRTRRPQVALEDVAEPVEAKDPKDARIRQVTAGLYLSIVPVLARRRPVGAIENPCRKGWKAASELAALDGNSIRSAVQLPRILGRCGDAHAAAAHWERAAEYFRASGKAWRELSARPGFEQAHRSEMEHAGVELERVELRLRNAR